MCFSNTEYIKKVFDGVFKCPPKTLEKVVKKQGLSV